jgi:hypothetical protein
LESASSATRRRSRSVNGELAQRYAGHFGHCARHHPDHGLGRELLLLNAFSPALFALIVGQVGRQNSLYALLASSILTQLAIELMSRRCHSAR